MSRGASNMSVPSQAFAARQGMSKKVGSSALKTAGASGVPSTTRSKTGGKSVQKSRRVSVKKMGK